VTTFVGVDPGTSGGLAAIVGDAVILTAMPDSEPAVLDWFLDVVEHAEKTVAVIEQVGGFMAGREGDSDDDGDKKRNRASAHTMFVFGCRYGSVRMAMIAAGLFEGEGFHAVAPRTWQKSLSIEPRRKVGHKWVESRSQFKRRLKETAVAMFPLVAGVTNKTADALLIAEHCRRRFC
jgi:hypothetical protein